jgi:hypothetical protein
LIVTCTHWHSGLPHWLVGSIAAEPDIEVHGR